MLLSDAFFSCRVERVTISSSDIIKEKEKVRGNITRQNLQSEKEEIRTTKESMNRVTSKIRRKEKNQIMK